ncbi:hypothetical protein [Shewanella sp. GXUN23E]|uniref:hypothetical protein n=1 Tax=Shewanella sp. GXUN23E TaxID=3422498 RepID=UPI003D7EF2AC
MNFSGYVVIDDNEQELNEIHQCLVASGVPCLSIQYQNDDSNLSGIDHVDLSRFIPRVIITDLNLTEGSLEPVNLAGAIASLLETLIKSGPYILFFWSKNKARVEPVVEILLTRFAGRFPFPLHWGVIDKTEVRSSPGLLKEKLDSIIQENPIFHGLLDWESRITKAALEASRSLYELSIPEVIDENYFINHSQRLSDLLVAISHESIGKRNAESFPEAAVYSGLYPVLSDLLTKGSTPTSIWRDALTNISSRITLDEKQKAALNSFYHIEEVPAEHSKSCKGVFVEICSDLLSDDTAKRKLELKLGRTLSDIFEQEFISTSNIQGDKTFRAERLQTAKDNITLGFVELSPDCDQAQKKVKLNRYLIAALVPEEFRELTIYKFGGNIKDRAHDGIYRLPDILLGGKIYTILLSYKYQIGTNPSGEICGQEYHNKWFGIPKFRLKEQILNDISYRCSQHLSRPGIVAFF